MSTPNSHKSISLTGYRVTFVDLREPKPRDQHTEIIVYDKEMIRAAEVLNLSVIDLIVERFAKGGYVVCSVEKETCLQACIDLRKVYDREKEKRREVGASDAEF